MISFGAMQAICSNWSRSDINNDQGNWSDARYEASRNTPVALYDPLCATMTEHHIDTPLRMAMFVAQSAFETNGYTWLEELASGAAYEGRADLGNTQPGDGVKFKGRGVFQVTGRANYAKCSQALFSFSTLLVDHPEKLAEPETAARSAGWFWDLRNLSKPADVGDVLTATQKINGGTNGLADRMMLYKRACMVLGIRT